MSLFRGKIYCYKCNKKHKYKRRAKKPIYVCSTYDNYGANKCLRNHIDEEELIWYVYGHFSIKREEVTSEFINDNVDRVIANDKAGFTIYYRNGEYSLVSPNKIIR